MIDMLMQGQTPSPVDPAMMGGGPPMGPMGGGMPDENAVLAMLLEAVMGRWSGEEAQLSGEKDVLMQTLLALAQAGMPMGPMGGVEGGMGPAEAPEDEFVE